MSDVNAGDLTEIKGPEDVFENYEGVGSEMRLGIEVELAFMDSTLNPMTLKQNSVLRQSASQNVEGDWIHNEPTSETVEVASQASSLEEIGLVLSDTQRKIQVLTDVAKDQELRRSYFQDLPDQNADALLSRIVDVDRYRAFFDPYREDLRDMAVYFSVCKSNQVSVSYSDPDHLLKNLRRLYYLAPFLFLFSDNSSGFSQNQAHPGHSGMVLRHKGLRQGRGGIPPYLFTSQSGEEYIHAHIQHVMRNPLFVYYGNDGQIITLPSGEWTSFEQLMDQGLNTATNYFFAETVLWPDVKIAALRDSSDRVFAHRYEARMFGVGIHQHQSAALIVGSLAAHEALASQMDELLCRFGFDPQHPEVTKTLLQNSYEAAREHNGKFFQIPYGTGDMSEFALQFADLLEPALIEMGFEKEAFPILTICRSASPDGLINRILFPDLTDVLQFQKSYDTQMFINPNNCAKILFDSELRQSGYHSGDTS